MDYATQNHLHALRQALEQRRSELAAEVHAAELARRGSDVAPDVDDLKAVAAGLQQAEVDEVQELRDVGELSQVEAALARLDDGSYGDCLRCGEAIPFQRLRVQPQAAYCADCQADVERGR